jgi:hypothetical protein
MTLLVALLALVQDPVQEMAARTHEGPGGKLLYRLYTPPAPTQVTLFPMILSAPRARSGTRSTGTPPPT